MILECDSSILSYGVIIILGSVPAICITEVMMEHIAMQLNKDPLEVKKLNFYQQNDVSKLLKLNHMIFRDI